MDTVRQERLARSMAALASSSRIWLLSQLQTPRILTELRIPSPDDESRAIARQAVRAHLRKLIDAGMVAAHPAERDSRSDFEYLVNPQMLFAVSEELRELAKLRPERATSERATFETRAPHVRPVAFPRLIVVRGLHEGHAFVLRPPAEAREASWLIGRRRGVSVSLDYDPFVSQENTLITWLPGEYVIESLARSRNGTCLNGVAIPVGTPVTLHHGDIVDVGRTGLVFQSHDPRSGRGKGGRE